MFDKFVPDIYAKSIYSINYEKLKSSGIKCMIYDLDNTLTPIDLSSPTKELKNLFARLKTMGFKLMILSNSGRHRVEPFKSGLGIDAGASSKKPKKDKYEKIMKNYNFKTSEIAMVGDQLITDIYGANRMDITSILVNPMGDKDFFVSIFNRMAERYIFSSLTKKDLFKRGRYYD